MSVCRFKATDRGLCNKCVTLQSGRAPSWSQWKILKGRCFQTAATLRTWSFRESKGIEKGASRHFRLMSRLCQKKMSGNCLDIVIVCCHPSAPIAESKKIKSEIIKSARQMRKQHNNITTTDNISIYVDGTKSFQVKKQLCRVETEDHRRMFGDVLQW